jgi:hypothetical protein
MSASQIDRITGMSHWHWICWFFFYVPCHWIVSLLEHSLFLTIDFECLFPTSSFYLTIGILFHHASLQRTFLHITHLVILFSVYLLSSPLIEYMHLHVLLISFILTTQKFLSPNIIPATISPVLFLQLYCRSPESLIQ